MTTKEGDLLKSADQIPGGMDNRRFGTGSGQGSGPEARLNPTCYKVPCVLVSQLPAEACLSVPYHTPSNLTLLKKNSMVCVLILKLHEQPVKHFTEPSESSTEEI